MRNISNKDGFTLVELIISLFLGIFICATIFSAYKTQNHVQTSQQSVVEMQQNVRAALNMLTNSIRQAGFDPTTKADSGFILSDTFTAGSMTPAVACNSSQLAFTADLDGDGKIDTAVEDINSDSSTSIGESEQIAYSLSSMSAPYASLFNLRRFTPTTGAIVWQIVAEYIQNIEFQYVLNDGTVTLTPDQDDLDQTVRINISILARARYQDKKNTDSYSYVTTAGTLWAGPADNYRRVFMTTSVDCRNNMSSFSNSY